MPLVVTVGSRQVLSKGSKTTIPNMEITRPRSTSQDTIQCRPNYDERKCGPPMSIDSTKTNVFPLCSVAAASLHPTKQEISESSKTCFLNESRRLYCSFRGASSLKDAMEISAGNNQRAIDTDLKNSLPSSEAPETTMHRDIVLKSILSKEGAEDKINSFFELGAIQHGTEKDPLSSLADVLGERKLALKSELPVKLRGRSGTLTSWIENAAAGHGVN